MYFHKKTLASACNWVLCRETSKTVSPMFTRDDSAHRASLGSSQSHCCFNWKSCTQQKAVYITPWDRNITYQEQCKIIQLNKTRSGYTNCFNNLRNWSQNHTYLSVVPFQENVACLQNTVHLKWNPVYNVNFSETSLIFYIIFGKKILCQFLFFYISIRSNNHCNYAAI